MKQLLSLFVSVSFQALASSNAMILKSPVICVGAGQTHLATSTIVVTEDEDGVIRFPEYRQIEGTKVNGPQVITYSSSEDPQPRLDLDRMTLKGLYSRSSDTIGNVECVTFPGETLVKVEIVNRRRYSGALLLDEARVACEGEVEALTEVHTVMLPRWTEEHVHSQLFKCAP